MTDAPVLERTCANCANSFQIYRNDRAYLACRKAGDDVEGQLAALMRQGACGPDAGLWEAK